MNAAILAAYIAGRCTVVMYKATQVERLLLNKLVTQECVACCEFAIMRLNDAEHVVPLISYSHAAPGVPPEFNNCSLVKCCSLQVGIVQYFAALARAVVNIVYERLNAGVSCIYSECIQRVAVWLFAMFFSKITPKSL